MTSESIHKRIRSQIAQQLLSLPLVVHQVQSLAVVLPLRPFLGDHEQPAESGPRPVTPRPAQGDQPVEPLRTERFEELVFQAQVHLPASGVSLPAGPTE